MTDTDFWKAYHYGTCWVCGGRTQSFYADLGYQHTDCDAGPNSFGGHYKMVHGVLMENTGGHYEWECPGPENCDGLPHLAVEDD